MAWVASGNSKQLLHGPPLIFHRKAELLKEFARIENNHRPVYPFPARQILIKYDQLALSIGMRELLKHSLANKEDYSQIWREAKLEKRAQLSREWLENLDDTLIIVDDVDSVEATLINQFLPRRARCLVLSTRNPDFIARNESSPYLLSPMQPKAAKEFLSKELRLLECPYSEDELANLAELLGNHLLAIAQAVRWISDHLLLVSRGTPTSNLINILTGSKHAERLGFLNKNSYYPRTSVSIMNKFREWILRLPEPASTDDSLIDFCSLIGFLDVKHSEFDFRHFLEFRSPELKAENEREAFPDYDLFTLDDDGLISKLKTLQNASMWTIDDSQMFAPRRLHIIWKECIRQDVGAEGRLRFVKQILRICHTMTVRDQVVRPGAHTEDWLPWVDGCLDVIEQFAIPLDSLKFPGDAMDYVQIHQSTRRSVLTFCVNCKTARNLILPGRVEDVEAQRMRTSARGLRQSFLALRAHLVEGYFPGQEGARIHAALDSIKLLASASHLEEESTLEEELTIAQERIAAAREGIPKP